MLMIGNGESLVVAGQALKFEGFALHCAAPATAAWQCIADWVNGLLRPIPLPISLRLDKIFKNDEQENDEQEN
jgi:hypothetical protein